MYGLVLGALAVWRITHLFHAEDGPGQILVALRRLAGRGFFGQLLDCFYCLSVWVAAPLALLQGERWGERLLLWPALSGAACLLERATTARLAPPPAIYYQDPKEDSDELLWQGEGRAAEHLDAGK